MVTGNRLNKREGHEQQLYPTCYAALPPLFEAEKRHLPKVIWEPHAGTGAIVRPLRNRGYEVFATDLHDWGFPLQLGGLDFLSSAADAVPLLFEETDWGIIANAPFGDLEEHFQRAAGLSPYCAMLARFSFFESEGRWKWWNKVGLQRVILIVDRLPMMHGAHVPEEQRLIDVSGLAYAWFILERGRGPRRSFPVYLRSWKKDAKRWPMMPGDEPDEAKLKLPLFPELEKV